MKVICAGLSKTGTKSLSKALQILGYNKVYDYPEAVQYAYDYWEKIFKGDSNSMEEILDQVYSGDVEAVVDIPHCYFFDYFYKKWPDAKVILTIRDEDDWYKSYKNMIETQEKKRPVLRIFAGFISYSARRFIRWHDHFHIAAYGSATLNKMKWISTYRRHNAYVKSVIPEEKLLICSISEGWEPICKFLDKDIPNEEFPYKNKGGTDDVIAEKIIKATNMIAKIQREGAILFAILSIFLSIIIFLF